MWTLDGERLVFIVSGDRPDAIYWRRANGAGEAEHLLDARSAEGWIGKGSQLRFLTLKANRDYGISLLDMTTRKVIPIIDLPDSAQHSSAMSPDGKWMAYASNETGRYEVWIEPYPRTGARHQITRDGGAHPLWRPDGRALYKRRTHGKRASQVADRQHIGVAQAPVVIRSASEPYRQTPFHGTGRRVLVADPITRAAHGVASLTRTAHDFQSNQTRSTRFMALWRYPCVTFFHRS